MGLFMGHAGASQNSGLRVLVFRVKVLRVNPTLGVQGLKLRACRIQALLSEWYLGSLYTTIMSFVVLILQLGRQRVPLVTPGRAGLGVPGGHLVRQLRVGRAPGDQVDLRRLEAVPPWAIRP